MKALALNIERDQWETTTGMDILDVPEPALNESAHPEDAGQVLIKPRYTGFCGSDKGIWFRHAFKEMIFDSIEREHASYRICGHELLGEVVDAGSYSAKAYGFKPGDIVSTESHIFCGRCHQCKIGEEHVCSDHLIIGISTNGCFADLVKLPVKELWRTDTDKIRPEVAAIQEPLGNAVHALSKVDVRGKSIAIFGCGTIGLFSILVARAMGATNIVGVDPNPANLKMAERLGVDRTVSVDREQSAQSGPAADEEIIAAIHRHCSGRGVDVAYEMSGSNQALNTAIQSVRPGGDVILFGLCGGDFTLQNFQEVILHGKTLHGIVGRRVFQTWYIMRNLLESKHHDLQDKIYEVILNKGEGTIVPFAGFDKDRFDRLIRQHPKIVMKH